MEILSPFIYIARAVSWSSSCSAQDARANCWCIHVHRRASYGYAMLIRTWIRLPIRDYGAWVHIVTLNTLCKINRNEFALQNQYA